MSSTNKTSRLGLSQFTGVDDPKWLTDYNNDMANIDGYVGKVTRTATVVVGLQSSGYTSDQVDVLIPAGTTNCASFITAAINKLPSVGGEVKLLEGVYTIDIITISKDNVRLNGTGAATKIVLPESLEINIVSLNTIVSNMSVKSTNSQSAIGFAIRETADNVIISNVFFEANLNAPTKSFLWLASEKPTKVQISGCSTNVQYVFNNTANNWRNIAIDGEARYVVKNTESIYTVSELAPGKTLVDMSAMEGDVVEIMFKGRFPGWATANLNITQPIIANSTEKSALLFNLTANNENPNNYFIGGIIGITVNGIAVAEQAWSTNSLKDASIIISSVVLKRRSL